MLYYYDNGLYKIISPGANHYGVSVVKGDLKMLNTASVISLPSADWGVNVIRHDLTFTKGYLTFKHKALAQLDQNIPMQYATFIQESNPVENPAPITWQSQPQR